MRFMLASASQLLAMVWRAAAVLVVLVLVRGMLGPLNTAFLLGVGLVLVLLVNGLLPHLAAAHLRTDKFCAPPPATAEVVRQLAEPLGVDVDVRLSVAEPLNAAFVSTGNCAGILVVGSGLVGDDLRAAVAHELGHCVANDSERNQGARAVELLAAYGVVTLALYLTFAPALSVLTLGLLGVRSVAAARHRVVELEADRFALSLVGPEPLDALITRLEDHGYGCPRPGIVPELLATHPLATQRRYLVAQARARLHRGSSPA